MRFPLFLSLVLTGCHSGPVLQERTVGQTDYFIPEVRGVPMRALPTNLDFAKVTRMEVLHIAHAYLEHVWTPKPQNAFHGPDAQGIQVDTPDSGFRPTGTLPGWWVPGLANRGIPYQWGGFSTLEEFDRGIAAGKYAGDIYTPVKRARLDDAVSKHAVGIDCSGFVSRCWKLPRSFSTREIPLICEPLKSYDELRAGDVLNTRNGHVLLFEQWLAPDHASFITYETGSPPTWKVLRHGLRTWQVKALGYQPYRYRNIRD